METRDSGERRVPYALIFIFMVLSAGIVVAGYVERLSSPDMPKPVGSTLARDAAAYPPPHQLVRL